MPDPAPPPGSPHVLGWRGARGHHLFVVDGSRLFDVEPAVLERLEAAVAAGRDREFLAALGLGGPPRIDDQSPADLPVHAFSLAVAQKCNLGCAYCYAQQGAFGGPARAMPRETALRAVDTLLAGAPPGGRVSLAFLGGEPLANRAS